MYTLCHLVRLTLPQTVLGVEKPRWVVHAGSAAPRGGAAALHGRAAGAKADSAGVAPAGNTQQGMPLVDTLPLKNFESVGSSMSMTWVQKVGIRAACVMQVTTAVIIWL